MQKVLVCMIARDASGIIRHTLANVRAQITSLKSSYDFTVSVYENDSSDNTLDLISGFDWKDSATVFVNSENVGSEKWESVESRGRIEAMAAARNKCMEAVDLNDFDLVLWLDVDYWFTDGSIAELLAIVSKEERDEADVASAYSLHADILRPNMELYDKWATRGEASQDWWTCTPYKFMPDVAPVYTTFNGLCVYKADPFKNGLRFSSESKNNALDVEHVSICEGFHDAGLNRVALVKKAISLHFHNGSNIIPWISQNNITIDVQ